ncbi:MAG: hypothetical protein KA715_14490 [Xanthomonadaceae bacterium]|nr:hypothetical protein [Xanthomonadaceae bacterium]
MNIFKNLVVVALVVGSFACNNDLNGIRPSIQSTASQLPLGLCSMVTISNQLKTNWRNTSPTTGRRPVDVYKMTVDYKVYATDAAEPAYKNFILGNATIAYEQKAGTDRVCTSWRTRSNNDGTTTRSCVNYEIVQLYDPYIPYGGAKTINVEFNNMLNQTVKVPSYFLFGLSRIWAKGFTTLGSELSYDNLSYQVPGTLPCFYTHIITLYNSRLYNGPEGFQGSRVATSEEVKEGLDTAVTGVSSFSLLTRAERDELRIINDGSTFKRIHSIYLDRQAKFSKYLLDVTKGKTISNMISDAILDGRIAKSSLTLARKSVTGEDIDVTDITPIVSGLFPHANNVIGDELAQGFTEAMAKIAVLQMSIDQ